jgi:hypothetical protein
MVPRKNKNGTIEGMNTDEALTIVLKTGSNT